MSRRPAVTASPLPKLSSHLCSHLKSHLLPSDASLSTFRCTPRPGHTGRSRAQEVPTSPTRGDASPSLLTPDSGVYSFPAHPRSQIHTKETEKRVYSYKAAPERQTHALLSPFQQTGAPCPTLTPPTRQEPSQRHTPRPTPARRRGGVKQPSSQQPRRGGGDVHGSRAPRFRTVSCSELRATRRSH